MNTFEITIQRKSGENWPMIAEYSRAGVLLPSRAEGTLALGPEDFQALISLLGQPKAYGTRLGAALFRDALRDAFVGALRESEDQLRVLLFVENSDSQADTPSLKTLRWERLCAPLDVGWDLLALNQRTPFSLYIPSTTDRRFPPIGRRDLRALVLVANPTGSERFKLAPFDVEATVASVGSALGAIPYDVLATVADAIGPPTLDELCRQLTDRQKQYTLLHVVCHGKLIAGGETVVYWANADSQVQPVTGTELLERLSQLRGPRGLPHFAFLSTCESASPEAEGALGGLAQRLVRELGMPAVVAMTERVTMKTAQALADSFYRRLRDSGEVDVALPEATAGLGQRADITVPALFSRLGGRPLFSDQLDRDLTNAEIRAGLQDLCTLLDVRAPVLREVFDPQAATLRETLGADATALSKATRQEREAALEEVNNLALEALDLSFNALALGQQPPPYDSRCPFRGLYPFRVEDREFFFGREALIKQLRQKLAKHNFLAVLGHSGSGKSSVILAGLMPALQQDKPGLQMAYLTPGNDPRANLEASLAKAPDPTAVLVVDQFEELFTLCTDEARRIAFIAHVLTLAQQRRVVITLRADFWGECAPYRELTALMQARQELMAPMDAAELRKAMEGQAGQVKLRFEAGLSNRILDDVQDEPGAMPLLQHALLRLWEKRHGRWLRTTEYEAIGGVKKAIAQTADEFYDRLSPADQAHMENIFVRLTRLDEDAVQGEKQEGTRRRVGLEELVPAGDDPAATKSLVQRLAGEEARLLVTRVNGVTQRNEVEVAHEALIRYWPRLQSWLKQNRADLLLRDKIRQEAIDWDQHQREESDERLVLRGGRLEDAAALPSTRPGFLNELESAYVNACVEWRQHLRRQEEERLKRELEAAQKLTQESEARREAEKKARQEAELRVEQEADARKTAQTRNKILAGLLVGALLAISFALYQWIQSQRQLGATITALTTNSQGLFDSNKDFDALVTSLKAEQLATHTAFWVKPDPPTLMQRKIALQQAVFWVREQNRLEGQHTAEVKSVSFSPDGRLLASGSADHTIRLWNVETGKVTKILGGQSAAGDNESPEVWSVSFSPDGRLLASRSADHTIRLWNVETGKVTKILEGQSKAAVDNDIAMADSVSFSRDGQRLASPGENRTIKLWDVTTGKVTKILSGNDLPVSSVSFSPDGRLLASGSWNNTTKLWDVATGDMKPLVPPKGYGIIDSVSFSPDGKQLASAGEDCTIKLWNFETKVTKILEGHSGRIKSVRFSPDSQMLASAGWDNTIKLWDVKTGKGIDTLLGHRQWVNSISFSRDGQWLASASDDSTVKLWNVTTHGASKAITSLIGHNDEVYSVSFSPDSEMLASAAWDGTIKLWYVKTGREIKTISTGGDPRIKSVSFSPNGQRLAAGGFDNVITLWDVATGHAIPFPNEGAYLIQRVSFSPNGRWLADASWDQSIRVYDVSTEKLHMPPLRQHEAGISDMSFSPDSTTIASASADHTIKLWNVATGHVINTLKGHSAGVKSVSFSPDGQQLASASGDQTIKLWNVATGGVINTLKGHRAGVKSVSFSPDGQQLASASDDQTIKLWDVATGQVINTLKGHKGYSVVSFSPNGSWLASGSNNRVILWDVKILSNLTLEDLRARGCKWVSGYLNNSVNESDHHLCDCIGTARSTRDH